ncbi:MAG: hypothetical protein IIA67_10055 [Planctomycetes bacterium]|nr:hypothetical protein [Planctomycetota bacterium]
MAQIRYNTVREVSYSPEQLTLLSDNLQSMGQLYSLSQLISSGPDPIRLAQVKDVIETVVSGRKYQVLLLRSQGKTFAEISLLLEISKSAVQSHHRQAVRRVRRALGLETREVAVQSS